MLGTCAYMSPEQAGGAFEQLDERCDVFGLGAMLCEILTGHRPTPGRLLGWSLGGRCAELGTGVWSGWIGCGADEELVALTKRCLAVEPSARPR